MKRCSLVLHTRGAPRLLRAVLKTVARQRVTDFEVLVADDGDTAISRDVVREFALMNPRIPVRHIVRVPASSAPLAEGRGAVVRQAFDAVATDYTIFIGTGTLVHPEFIAAHLRFRGDGRALVAPRGVVVKAALVQQLLELRSSCRGDLGWLARHTLRGELGTPSRGVIVRAPWLRRWLSSPTGTLEGGHFSLATTSLRQLLAQAPGAGLDEPMSRESPPDQIKNSEPTFDESGLGARLTALGLSTFDMSRLAVTYHLEGYALAASPPAQVARGRGRRGQARTEPVAATQPPPAQPSAAQPSPAQQAGAQPGQRQVRAIA